MPTTYEKAGPEINDEVTAVMRRLHSGLAEAGVTIETLLAANEDGPAVMLHGWPCKATIKVNSLKDRAAGCCDARLTLDAETWASGFEDERAALLDHELQ